MYGGINSALSHCLPVLSTVPLVTHLDPENGNRHTIKVYIQEKREAL
jgi:hypothetical protein